MNRCAAESTGEAGPREESGMSAAITIIGTPGFTDDLTGQPLADPEPLAEVVECHHTRGTVRLPPPHQPQDCPRAAGAGDRDQALGSFAAGLGRPRGHRP